VYSGRETEHPRVATALIIATGIGLGMLLIAAGLVGFMW
jgi:hypothetical protein